MTQGEFQLTRALVAGQTVACCAFIRALVEDQHEFRRVSEGVSAGRGHSVQGVKLLCWVCYSLQ